MSDIVLGIDLGTTNSVVAVADGGQARVLADADGNRLIPSVVSFPRAGPVVVGDVARERRLVDADNTVYAIKRLIGRPFDSPEVGRAQERFAFRLVEGDNRGVRVDIRGDTYALAEISAYVLRECRRVAEQMLGEPVDKAVITVPANFNELQRSATKAAGKVAGLDVLRILNEPTAAAVAYGTGTQGSERVAVYDFGGGTFDITVLDLEDDVFEVVATAGDTFLGGDDIDLLVAEHMSDRCLEAHGLDPRGDRQAFERLRAAAEWVKCQLSTQEEVSCTVAELVTATHGGALDLDFRMTREELEARALPLANQSLRVCAEALRLGHVEPTSIDSVVLVGGSTRIPLVRRMVRNFFQLEPRTDIDPDLVVALGAAIQGYALSERTPQRSVSLLPGPSAERALEVRRRKQDARAARPPQPAFAPPEPGPTGQAPSPSAPPDRPKPPSIPKLPRPSQLPAAARAYRPPSPPGARPRPPIEPAAALEPMELDLDHRAEVESLEPNAFGDLGTGERELELESLEPNAFGDLGTGDLDLELDLDAVAPRPRAPAPPPPPPRPRTPFDDMVDALPPEETRGRPGPAGPFGELDLELDLEPGPRARAEPVRPLPPPVPVASAPAPDPPGAPPPQPVIPMGSRPPPVLMDVTPHSLGIETVGGFCERIIARNAPIPIEQTRIFTTAQDDQESVRVTVCQGELRTFADNQALGELELTGLRAARRGEVHIAVTFLIDANGTLDVEATDATTGAKQTIRINLLGGHGDDEMEDMRRRQEASLG